MTKTNYTIKKELNRFTVYQGEVAIAKGMLNEEDALHAIWCINGKNKDEFYSQIDGIVFVGKAPL